MSGDVFLIDRKLCFYCVFAWLEWARKISGVYFISVINPIDDLITSKGPHLPIPSHWGLGFNTWILRIHKHSSVYTVVTSSCIFSLQWKVHVSYESPRSVTMRRPQYTDPSKWQELMVSECTPKRTLHVFPLTDTTTYSTERSEHFKPCRDKDLAYCLNDGECFVIETLTGSHKHCR